MADEGEYVKANNDTVFASEFNSSVGKILTVEAGENITAGNVIYLKQSDGKCYKSDTGTADDIRADGIAFNTDNTGNDIYVITKGLYQTTGLTANADYYLGAAGAISTTQSGVRLGHAYSTTRLYLNIIQDDKDAVGTVKAYLKDFTGIPSNNVTAFWVECAGQALSDAESPLNGQTIPDLNADAGADQRFLRGNTASGGTGGVDSHSHGISTGSSFGCSGQYQPAGSTGGASNLPPYYEVVWIMKVK
ncbi:MAG: hypothetical protein Unbinned1693contig1002_38 [Prokaryotic dsDNA virus sp.]|jgi:hypothetical protein|nr:MAG: hypothetical protein Unbinned1693contig1002_38 [Prokaryotic dsDNA virus sp.]|tara:strand:+ start:2563 stop:3306 length:744 start_codon:yes stop_codon:yes gene_type:complete